MNDDPASSYLNAPEDYDRLNEPRKRALAAWIKLAIVPAPKQSDDTSYFLKHEFERQTHLYVTNGQFKGAMIAAGYETVSQAALNWKYRIKPANSKFKRRLALDEKTSPVFAYDISHIPQAEREQLETLVKEAHESVL